jgi:hypothetical protein
VSIKARIIDVRDDGRAKVEFPCPGKKSETCMQSVWQRPATGCMWQWDGNREAPTLSPSIDCQICGWHGFIVAGTLTGTERA